MKTNRNIRSAIAATLAVAVTTTTVKARIGETPQECANRYGPPTKKTADDQFLYQKSGLGVVITFFNGKADAIAYRKIAENVLGKGEEISDNEIELLLKSNSAESPWKKRTVISMDREWETEDGKLFATYVTFENFLLVATKDYLAREAAAKAKKEGKNLDGF